MFAVEVDQPASVYSFRYSVAASASWEVEISKSPLFRNNSEASGEFLNISNDECMLTQKVKKFTKITSFFLVVSRAFWPGDVSLMVV